MLDALGGGAPGAGARSSRTRARSSASSTCCGLDGVAARGEVRGDGRIVHAQQRVAGVEDHGAGARARAGTGSRGPSASRLIIMTRTMRALARRTCPHRRRRRRPRLSAARGRPSAGHRRTTWRARWRSAPTALPSSVDRGGLALAASASPGSSSSSRPRNRHLRMSALGVAVRWMHLAAALGLVGIFTMLLLAGRSDRPTARAWEARVLALIRWLAGARAASPASARSPSRPRWRPGRAGAALEPVAWVQRAGAAASSGPCGWSATASCCCSRRLVLLREREVLHRGLGRVPRRGRAACRRRRRPPWPGPATRRRSSLGLAAALVDALHLDRRRCVARRAACLSALLPGAASRETGADARPFAVLAVRALLRRGPRR